MTCAALAFSLLFEGGHVHTGKASKQSVVCVCVEVGMDVPLSLSRVDCCSQAL